MQRFREAPGFFWMIVSWMGVVVFYVLAEITGSVIAEMMLFLCFLFGWVAFLDMRQLINVFDRFEFSHKLEKVAIRLWSRLNRKIL